MGRAHEFIVYITGVLDAVAKGFKVVHDNWPVNNPFVDTSKGKDGVGK